MYNKFINSLDCIDTSLLSLSFSPPSENFYEHDSMAAAMVKSLLHGVNPSTSLFISTQSSPSPRNAQLSVIPFSSSASHLLHSRSGKRKGRFSCCSSPGVMETIPIEKSISFLSLTLSIHSLLEK